MTATQAQFDEAVAAYLAMEQDFSDEAEAHYVALLVQYRLMDSEIVDYCYSR